MISKVFDCASCPAHPTPADPSEGGFGTMKRINALYDIDWDATENSHGEIWYINPPDSIQ